MMKIAPTVEEEGPLGRAFQLRVGLLLLLFVLAVGAALMVPPVAQDPAFHHFVDKRTWMGIPNVGDVMSNIAFLLVGLMGLVRVIAGGDGSPIRTSGDKLLHATVFAGIALVALGSAYYHWAPTNDTLLWDRLPMTIAFMGFFAVTIADRIHRQAGLLLLPVLLAAGVASVVYWHMTEAAGQGDLRPYALVQFFPMLVIPLIVYLFRPGGFTDGRYVAGIIGFYAVAKVLEFYDVHVFEHLGGLISGHTLKHLAAALASYLLYRMVLRRDPDTPSAGELACRQGGGSGERQ